MLDSDRSATSAFEQPWQEALQSCLSLSPTLCYQPLVLHLPGNTFPLLIPAAQSVLHKISMPDASRPKSLRLSSRPVNVPVPPSLAKSPHLHSPQSIFRRAISVPRLPSEEDEVWLRDTVPLANQMGEEPRNGVGAGKPSLSEGSSHSTSTNGVQVEEVMRGRSEELRVLAHSMALTPPSPPLVRWSSIPSSKKNWIDRTNMAQSDAHLPPGYFTHH